MTRRMPLAPLVSNRRPENCSAAEIDVMRAREMGKVSSRSAKARADAGPSMMVQGMTTCWVGGPAHSM